MAESRSDAFRATSVPEAYDRYMVRQLFVPWGRELVARAGVGARMSVLDVASGAGVVARLAAAATGPIGRVVASDISPAMLAVAAAKPAEPGAAPIEFRECSATELDAEESSFERVLCQHGLQFIPDRGRAVGEMHRVLAGGGVAAASTWAAERPLGLFGEMVETLRECGLPETYPGAFDASSYVLTASELAELFGEAGFDGVTVRTIELDSVWESAGEAVGTLSGTPFGPVVASLPAEQRDEVRGRLAERLGGEGGGPVTVRTASNVAWATKRS